MACDNYSKEEMEKWENQNLALTQQVTALNEQIAEMKSSPGKSAATVVTLEQKLTAMEAKLEQSEAKLLALSKSEEEKLSPAMPPEKLSDPKPEKVIPPFKKPRSWI